MKLGIYCRISRLKDGNDLSIEDQKQKGISKANELNIPYELYIDEGLSGASEKIEDRPEFERFIGDVTSGKLTHCYAFDQSRFERNPQIRFVLLALFKKNKIKYYTSMDGEVDLHDPQSEFFGDLLSVINKYHVTTTKIKVKSALKVRAREGKSRGIMPYGYTKDSKDMIIIDEVESEVVKRIFQLSLNGIGTNTIAETLNSEGIQTRYAKMGEGTLTVKNKYTGTLSTKDKSSILWSPNTINSIIKNTFYKGERNYSGEILEVPAIFPANYWDKVNFNLPLNKNNSGKKVEYRFLLKGLLRCGVCGRNMYGHKRANKHDNHYMCSSKRIKGANCGNRSINIDKIEYMIWEILFYEDTLINKIQNEFHFDENEIIRIDNKVTELNQSIVGFQNERKRAIDLVIKGVINENDIADNLKDIDSKIVELKIIINENYQKKFVLENSEKIIFQYKEGFKKFSEITTFEKKFKIIHDFISDIKVTYLPEVLEYDIDIDFKIEVPKSYAGMSIDKKAKVWYWASDTPRESDDGVYTHFNFDSEEVQPLYNGIKEKPEDKETKPKKKSSKKDDDKTGGGSGGNIQIDKFFEPLNYFDNVSIEGDFLYPYIMNSNIGEFSGWRKLSATGRNFFST